MTNITRNRGNRLHRLRRYSRAAACLAALAAPLSAVAADLSLPANADETAREASAPDSHRLALAPFANGALPVETVEGAVTRTAWRIRAQGITTLQLLAPLRDQLVAEGYEILFECAAADCGGFDFRYALRVFPEPAMHVDLYDYRYLSARRGPENGAADYVALLISRTASTGFVQITTIAPPGAKTATVSAGTSPVAPSAPATPLPAAGDDLPLVQALTTRGHAVLADLAFETGSSTLGSGSFASLADLAAFLNADPTRRVALVGHTDTVGSLDGNIALSKRRAASVLERLVSAHGVPRGQLEAEGMGYLSPITTNLTPAGREQNRRVEAILLNTD